MAAFHRSRQCAFRRGFEFSRRQFLKPRQFTSLFRPGDIVIIILLALGAASSFLFLRGQPGRSVEIYADGVLQGTFPLESGRRIEVEGPLGVTVVQIEKGSVRIVSSPCPNHLCVHMGSISRGNSTVVCVPNRVMIRISAGVSDFKIDAVTE